MIPATEHHIILCIASWLLFAVSGDSSSQAELVSDLDMDDFDILSMTSTVSSTVNLRNPQEENSKSTIFWVFVLTSIFMISSLVAIRAYSLWKTETEAERKADKEKDERKISDRAVYGDPEIPRLTNQSSSLEMQHNVTKVMSPKSTDHDIEEYVLRELNEIDASYPGFQHAPRSSSVGYIEAIYARYSAENKDKMQASHPSAPKLPALRIQINGQDVSCTPKGIKVVDWSPTSPKSPTPPETESHQVTRSAFHYAD